MIWETFLGFFWRFISSRKIRIRQQMVIQFRFVQFRGEFSITWTALFKMVFPIAVMTSFSIGRTFTTVVRIFPKLAFFNYLCSLSGGSTSRSWVFWNLVQIDGLIWLKLGLSPSKKISFYLLQWKPFKNDEKCFLFHLKSSFLSQNI